METTAAPAAAVPNQRCRAVKISGQQCLNRALDGQDCCYEHADHWFPTWPEEGQEVKIPLLEDANAIRYVLTMVVHGSANGRLPEERARVISYACQVARSTLPREIKTVVKEQEEKPHVEESVVAVERSADHRPMGARQRYAGPSGAFEPQWSFAKYMYEKECESYKRPLPACAADMPPSGWLTEEEMQEPFEDFNERNNARADRLRAEAEAWDLANPEEAQAIAEVRARRRAAYLASKPRYYEEPDCGDAGIASLRKVAGNPVPESPESPGALDLNASAETHRASRFCLRLAEVGLRVPHSSPPSA